MKRIPALFAGWPISGKSSPNEKGSALLIVPFVLLALILLALVVDFVLVFVGRKYAHTIAEAASLAGALSAEIVVESHVDEETGEIEYEYFADIVPEKAEQAASKIISKYASSMDLIQINEIKYECIEEDGYNIKYVVTLKCTQKILLAPLWSEEGRRFEIARLSEAKLDFQGEG